MVLDGFRRTDADNLETTEPGGYATFSARHIRMRAVDHSEVIVTSLMSNSARLELDQYCDCPKLDFESGAGGLGKRDHPPITVPRFGRTRCSLRRHGDLMRSTGLTNRGKGFGYRVLRDLRAFAARSFTLRLPRHVVE